MNFRIIPIYNCYDDVFIYILLSAGYRAYFAYSFDTASDVKMFAHVDGDPVYKLVNVPMNI